MLRYKNEIAGREPRNEDFQLYIQAFDIFEQMFTDLNYGTFVVFGCVITGTSPNANISAGVIYYDGSLCIFDGASNVSLALRLSKQTTGTTIREFFDESNKATIDKIELIQDIAGPLFFSETTPRADDRFFRFESGRLRADIGTVNDLTIDNIFSSDLEGLAGLFRKLPEPDGSTKYMKIGQFSDTQDQHYEFIFSGCGSSWGKFTALLTAGISGAATSGYSVVKIIDKGVTGVDSPEFLTKHIPGSNLVELWVRSASTPLTFGIFEKGSILQTGRAETAGIGFTFENSFSWIVGPTLGISALVKYIPVADDGYSGVIAGFSSMTIENGIITSVTP